MITDNSVQAALARFLGGVTGHSLTQCGLALLVVGVTGGLVLQGQPIPELWAAITGAVVGSYFTSYPAPERANNQKQEKSNG